MSRTAENNCNSSQMVVSPRGLLSALFLLILLPAAVHGEEIERLLAAVNGSVITESDLVMARHLRAIISGGGPGSTKDRRQEIEGLIDQELIRQELRNFKMGQEDETHVRMRLKLLQDAYAQKGGLSEALRRVGLSEEDLMSYLRFESAVEAFVNFRFRPFATVSEDEIKAYYDERLVVQLQKSGLPLPPREQVAGKIAEILREEKINTMLEQWIQGIRKSSQIEYFDEMVQESMRSPQQTAGK